jgi:hypothetical protein
MVVIRVAVADLAVAEGLVQRLAGLSTESSVAVDDTHNEVRVRSKWDSRAVVEVIGMVESRLAADRVGLAVLSIGDRSCTMIGEP